MGGSISRASPARTSMLKQGAKRRILLASPDGAADPPRQHALSGLDRSLGARQMQVRRFASKIFAGRLPGQRFDAGIAHDGTNSARACPAKASRMGTARSDIALLAAGLGDCLLVMLSS